MHKLKLLEPLVVAGWLLHLWAGMSLGLDAGKGLPERLVPLLGAEICWGRGKQQQLVLSWDLMRCFREAVLPCWKSAVLPWFWGSQHACWWSSEIASALLHHFIVLFFEPIPEQSENQFRVANSSYSDQRNPLHFWAICVCFSCSNRSLNALFVGVFLESLTGFLSAGSFHFCSCGLCPLSCWTCG